MRSVLVFSMAVASVALVAACSSDDDDGSTSGSAPATGCAADDRKDVYTAGLSKPAGDLSVKLVESNPGPPVKGKATTMTIEVLDAAGAPVDGATLTVTPWMPDHAHGSGAKAVVTPQGGGRYKVDNVYLPMAGLWQIKVDVQTAGGGALKEAMFQFCLDG